MFSVRIVKADHYLSIPIPGLDVRYSDFRGFEVKQVPVIRIFGSTSSGQKVCLHIHGVFPYFYIPYDGCIEKEKFVYQIASGIDKALNVSLGNSNSHTQHVYKVNVVSAIPLYGFHSKAHQFLKIYFYNPLMIKKASDLLQNGVILGQVFQPHEAHIPFILQFFMDYNLHGMSFVNLASVRYRQGVIEGSDFKAPPLDNVPQELLLPSNILRVSTCKLEVDAVAADILNQQEISAQQTSNPGLRAIWDEEKERRRNENRNSQFTPQSSQVRAASPTESERFHLERLKKRIQEVSLSNENVDPVMEKSLSGDKLRPYPAPTLEGVNYLEASFVSSHVDSLCSENELNKSVEEKTCKYIHTEQGNVEENEILSSPVGPEPNSSQFSTLNSLVEILQDLIEDDSVLGSQCQEINDNERTSDNEDEVLSQILDSKELEKEFSPHSPLRFSDDEDEEDADTDRREKNFILPQLDGANDQLGEDEDEEELTKHHQIMYPKKIQQEQLLRIVPDCVSRTSDLPEIVIDYSRDNISLHSDLPVICESVGFTENKVNMGSYIDLEVVNKTEMGSPLPLELTDNSDSFINETSDSCLQSLDENDEQKLLFFCESIDADDLDDSKKGIHPKSLLLGDPWLTAQPTISDKDEYSDEHLSYSKDVWPIDTEGNLWIPASEKYFNETPLIKLREENEISSHYETADLTEFSVEKIFRENRVPSSETKRRLCSLIKSRTKAREVQSVNQVDSELINVDDIVNCENTTVNEYENCTPFGAIFQGSDYEQFLDVSFRDGEQTILSNVEECNLLKDSDLKNSSCAIEECNKSTSFDQMSSKLKGLGEKAFEINSCNKLKPKKKSTFSQSYRIDKISSDQKHPDVKNQKGMRDHLVRDSSNCCLSKPKKVGRKSKAMKQLESATSNKTDILEEDKIENNYCLRNKVKNTCRKRRKRPKESDVQLKSSESVHSVSDLAVDVLQDSMNIDKRTVKERLGILVRNSIGKKCPVKESSMEEKSGLVSSLISSPKTRQSFNSSRSVRRLSSLPHCEKSILPDSNFTLSSRKGGRLITKPNVVSKVYKSRNPVKVIKNIEVKPPCDTESSLQVNKLKSSSISVDNNIFSLNSHEMKEDELAKKRIGQYVRQRLGKLVESRSKLTPQNTDNASVLDSSVPSLSGKTENCNKILTRYQKKVKVLDLEESSISSLGMSYIGSVDVSVQNICDSPCASEVFSRNEKNCVDSWKDTVVSEKNCEVSGLSTDNNNIVDITFVRNTVPIKRNCGDNESQESGIEINDISVKDEVPMKESGLQINDSPSAKDGVPMEESGIQMNDSTSVIDGVPLEEYDIQINNSPSVKDKVPVEESDLQKFNTTSIEGRIVNNMVSPEMNSEVNELLTHNNNVVVASSVNDAITSENNCEANLLQTNNSSSTEFSFVKDALTLDNSEKNKLQPNCKSICNKEVVIYDHFNISDEIASVYANDLLNIHSIRPCYVRVQKWNINKHKGLQIAKYCDKRVTSSKRKQRKKSAHNNKIRLESTNDISKLSLEHNLETINSENKLTKNERIEEETDSQNVHDVLSINTASGVSNSMDEQNNRLECVELNMKCVVPNSKKSLDKTVQKTRDVGSLKAVVQAESPRVADTLDTLPQNPAQTVRHYAPGGTYLHSADTQSLHLLGEYLREDNSVQVAKIPQLGSSQFTKSVYVSPSEKNCQHEPSQTNKPINMNEKVGVSDDGSTEFLSFTRGSLKRRSLRSDESYGKKREKSGENNAEKTTCNKPSHANVSLQKSLYKNAENEDINQKHNNERGTSDKSFEIDEQCANYQITPIKNHNLNEINKKLILGNSLKNDSLADEECSVVQTNSNMSFKANREENILNPRVKSSHLEVGVENKQIIVSEQPTELLHISKISASGKTYVKEKMMNVASPRNTRRNSENKTKINSIKCSKRISVNAKLMTKHDHEASGDSGGNCKGNIEESISFKMQLRSVSSLNNNVDVEIRDLDDIRKAVGETVLNENKQNLKAVNIVNGESCETFCLQTDGEKYSEIQNKEMIPGANGDIFSETFGQKSSLPCVDGANDSCDSDATNGFVLLTSRGRKLKNKMYKKVVKTQSKRVLELKRSQTCDVRAAHEEKLESESSFAKNSPRLSPKKQIYKPLDVVIKKSPLKNKSNAELKLVDPSLDVKAGANQSSHENSDDLRKYLPVVLKRFVTEHDIKKFQPVVMVNKLKSCISKRQTVNVRALRPRRKKIRDEKCICSNIGERKTSISGEKCEKLKGVSLELQHSELSKKMDFLYEPHGEELAKVTCQANSDNDEEHNLQNTFFESQEKSVIESINVLKSALFKSETAVVSPNTIKQLSMTQPQTEKNEFMYSLSCKSNSSREVNIPGNKDNSPMETAFSSIDVPNNEKMREYGTHDHDETSECVKGTFVSNNEKNLSQKRDVAFTPSTCSKPELDYLPDGLNIKCVSKSIEKGSNRSVICVPKKRPPTRKQVLDGLSLFNLSEHKFLKPFFSNVTDVVERKEVGNKDLKILSNSVKELELFESMISELKGLSVHKNEAIQNLWEQSQSSDTNIESIFKEGHMKEALAGQRETILTPSFCAPSVKDVKLWAKARASYKKKPVEIMNKCKSDETNLEPHLLNTDESTELLLPVLSSEKQSLPENVSAVTNISQSMLQHSSEKLILKNDCTPLNIVLTHNDSCQENNTIKISKDLDSLISNSAVANSSGNNSYISKISDCNTVDNLPAESQFFHQLVTPEERNASTSHDTLGFKMSYENLQDCRAVIEPQYLTLLTIELHIQTRGDLRPDPAHDQVCAAFYCIQNDVPEESLVPNSISGMIVVQDPSYCKHDFLTHSIEMNCKISYVMDERSLMKEIVHLVLLWDPDILAGYEVEMLSWGYLFERAFVLELNLCPLVSRIPGARHGNKSKNALDENVIELQEEFSLLGRIVLNVWRLMRHEVALQSYTFENVSFHVLHERIPLVSFKTLTQWWGHRTRYYCGRVADHYLLRVRGTVRILEQLDLINRTSELARIFGIQFYEVLSRGSQFRVESMMLRLAKPLNYIPVSPSIQQRARMRAPEYLQLIMEPESQLYVDPVIVLDFQSLYPSIIIAYNYCFSTCLGRIEHLGQSSPFEFGSSHLRVPPDEIKCNLKNLNISPGGVVFVDTSVRKGILPRMLEEILETRLMVKKSMKEHKENKTLQRVLHSRQLGLKLIANVTYGYTAANFSGRMSCVEIADSVVSKGRETLERAIYLVENTPQWGARIVYGDTDSLFVLVSGRSREDAFVIGAEIAEAVTQSNPSPIKLKLEKVYQPCILQTKKRYVGYMYESSNQNEPVYDAKGIETVRRDGCPAVAKVLEKSLRLLFETKDISKVKSYVQRKFSLLLEGQMSIQDLTFAREYRGSGGYKPGACVPALELTKRWLCADPRSEPRVSERVPYIIVHGAPNVPLIQLVKSPHELLTEPSLRVHAHYYVSRVLCPPLARCFSLLGADVPSWYTELPRRTVLSLPTFIQSKEKKRFTISQYFSTSNCPVCHQISQLGICSQCQNKPQNSAVILAEKLHEWERHYYNLEKICQSCCGYFDKIECISLDCPVMYHRNQAKYTMLQESFIQTLLENLSNPMKL